MMRQAMLRQMLQVRRCSIAAKDTTTLNSFSQENAAEKSKDGKDNDVSGRVVQLLGVASAGVLAWWIWQISSHTSGELKLRRDAKERLASGYKATDPFAIRAALAHHLRFIKPDEASEIAEFGIHVSLYGLTPELRKHPQFALLQNMKDDHDAMSWADLASYMAYHALLEMGGPMVHMEPKFGRTQIEATKREGTLLPFPSADASYEDLKAFGDQFDLSLPELISVVGGHSEGSVLFTRGVKRGALDTSIYKKFVSARQEGRDGSEAPFHHLLGATDYTKDCADVFARDHLYWNMYFSHALEKILTRGWTGLRQLPDRFEKSHNDSSWCARQKDIYGVETSYVGASYRK